MTIITLPPEIEQPLAIEAIRRGTTPEALAIEGLRSLFVGQPAADPHATLLEYLKGYVGTIQGSDLPYSEDCGGKHGL